MEMFHRFLLTAYDGSVGLVISVLLYQTPAHSNREKHEFDAFPDFIILTLLITLNVFALLFLSFKGFYSHASSCYKKQCA